MTDPGRYVDKAGLGDRHLLAANHEIDFRSQIVRIIHIAAYKANNFIEIRMSVFRMRPWYGAHDPTSLNVK